MIQTNKENKKERSQTVTKMVTDLSQEYNLFNDSGYLNLLENHHSAEALAAVSRMVMELPFEQSLLPRRIPGSNPGRSASTHSLSITKEGNI